ncbi:MAG: hypothetical protein ACLQGP_40695 [Isosphaeraceae bacterium]
MRVPKRELPDVESIRERAGWNLPAHYRLNDVRCEYGSMALPGVPDDFQIVIEYENLLEKPDPDVDDIEAYEAWAEPLVAQIREEWPASTLRILLHETVPTDDHAT